MSSAVIVFVQAICKCSQKCLAQKVQHLGLLGPIPMIQPPFCSSCVSLAWNEVSIKFGGLVVCIATTKLKSTKYYLLAYIRMAKLKFANIFAKEIFWVQRPNLIPINISGYTTYKL